MADDIFEIEFSDDDDDDNSDNANDDDDDNDDESSESSSSSSGSQESECGPLPHLQRPQVGAAIINAIEQQPTTSRAPRLSVKELEPRPDSLGIAPATQSTTIARQLSSSDAALAPAATTATTATSVLCTALIVRPPSLKFGAEVRGGGFYVKCAVL